MKRYFIKLSYDGTDYHGWQIQQNAHTVQEELNNKLSILLNKTINVVGCGRTDTGVHAREFYAHFDIEDSLGIEVNDLVYKLNRFLPSDISIQDIFPVHQDVHARFSATSRMYKYYFTRRKSPFHQEYSELYIGDLDMEAMQKAADLLSTYIDFTSFSKLHTQTATNNCVIQGAEWEEIGDQLVFSIRADRFLRNMVRAIVGTLMEVGKKKISVDDVANIIEAKDRSKAGFSVPAKALFLEEVSYPELSI